MQKAPLAARLVAPGTPQGGLLRPVIEVNERVQISGRAVQRSVFLRVLPAHAGTLHAPRGLTPSLSPNQLPPVRYLRPVTRHFP